MTNRQPRSSDLAESAESQAQTVSLAAKAVRLLEEGSVDEAVIVQRQLVSVLTSSDGASGWRTRTEQALLLEMERACTLNEQQRKAYLVAYQRLAQSAQKIGIEDYDSAGELLDKALEGFTTVLGENFLGVARSLERLGLVTLRKGDPSKAAEHVIRAAAVWKVIVGDDHPSYANALRMAGEASVEARNLKQADALLRDALTRQRKLFGARGLPYAESLEMLSRVMLEQDRLPEAEALCLEAMSIAQDWHRQDSPSMAASFFSLADISIAYEEYANADANLRRSLVIYERVLPPWNPVIARVLDRHASVLRKLDRPDEAKAMEARAESIRAQLRPPGASEPALRH
ncbi:MAG: tetratricopeptide repeat protein [Planctomycetia bacterium]|nr:tetratricopeptide repeat protein [Planctomycetia bacterium]